MAAADRYKQAPADGRGFCAINERRKLKWLQTHSPLSTSIRPPQRLLKRRSQTLKHHTNSPSRGRQRTTQKPCRNSISRKNRLSELFRSSSLLRESREGSWKPHTQTLITTTGTTETRRTPHTKTISQAQSFST